MSSDEELVVAPPAIEQLEESTCWRCGLKAGATNVCPHCAAVLSPLASNRPRHDVTVEDSIKALVVSFAILLLSGLVHGAVLEFMVGDRDVLDDQLRRQVLYEMLAVETFDTLVIVVVIAKYGFRLPGASPSASRRSVAWGTALPVLGMLLAFNWAYHWTLRVYLGESLLEDELTVTIDALLIVVYCVQPAIVEELYFRGFALGTLKNISSTAVAIGISAVMFALVHLAVPLSLPYLACFGLVVGTLRVYSGTMWLPIILHFLHNLVIMLS